MEALRKTGAVMGSAAAAPRELLKELTGNKTSNAAAPTDVKDAQAAVPMPRRAAPDKTGHPELNDYIRARAKGEVSDQLPLRSMTRALRCCCLVLESWYCCR